MTNRYVLAEKPGHPCCWTSGVEDTNEPSYKRRGRLVMECDDEDMAALLVDLLNAQDEGTPA